MLELFGDYEAICKEYCKRDRFASWIRNEDHSSILEVATINAKRAYDWILQQGFQIEEIKAYVSRYCEISYKDNRDILAYSDIRFPQNAMTIYLSPIENLINTLNVEVLDLDKFINLFILHEFYHYIEEYNKVPLEKYPIQYRHFGFKRSRDDLDALSEISATLFMRFIVGDVAQYIQKSEGPTS